MQSTQRRGIGAAVLPAVMCSLVAFCLLVLPATQHAQAAASSTPTVPKPTCTMSGNVNNGSITVHWDSQNAAQVSITSVGPVGLSGTVNLLLPLAQPSTYVGTFVGPGGTVTCSVSAPAGMAGATTVDNSLPSDINSGSSSGAGGTYSNGANGNSSSVSSASSGGLSSPNGGLVPCGVTTLLMDPSGFAATNCSLCDFVGLFQNIIQFLLGISTVICVALFAYAGILFFTNTANSENISKAKAIFKDVFIGFIIALSGYFVVQTLLNVLVKQSFYSGGNWANIQCSTDRPRTNQISTLFSALTTNNAGSNGIQVAQGGGSSGGSGPQCQNNYCSPAALQAAGFTVASQAAAMSCIAQTESSGNASLVDMIKGVPSTHTGLFQIGNDEWTQNATGNCKPLSQKLDAACNTSVALSMFKTNGYQPWTGSSNGVAWNPKAMGCVNTYDPGTSVRTQ